MTANNLSSESANLSAPSSAGSAGEKLRQNISRRIPQSTQKIRRDLCEMKCYW